MDESVFYIAEGDPSDKHGQESFALASSIHFSQQHASFRQARCSKNGAVLTGLGSGERLFVACNDRALINVYAWGKDSPDQRMPVPEQLKSLAVCDHPSPTQTDSQHVQQPPYRVPWLLAAGSKTGKLYIWDLSSGDLLCVKEAHLQSISVLKFSRCGTFLVTGGDDARCAVWNTLDLINQDKGNQIDRSIKPYASFTDHTLSITDLIISESALANDLKLYTASQDGTVRIYDIMTKSQITCFVLPSSIECVAKDPANRALYAGMANGLIRTIPLYKINPSTLVLEAIGGSGKIITIRDDPDLRETFVQHQQALPTKNSRNQTSTVSLGNEEGCVVTKLTVSFDGTNIISGDSFGRVYVSDIITKQVVKSLIPHNSSIAQIQTLACPIETVSASKLFSSNDKSHRLLPPLKRIIAEGNITDNILYKQIPDSFSNKETFEDWLSRKASEEFDFQNLSSVDSTVKFTGSDSRAGSSNSSELKEKLDVVSNAYTELRKKHEELLSEHKKILNSSQN